MRAVLSGVLRPRVGLRAMSGVTVKVYHPSPAEQKYPPEMIRAQFFNMAAIDPAFDESKQGDKKYMAELGEQWAEKLAYYKPVISPNMNKTALPAKKVKVWIW